MDAGASSANTQRTSKHKRKQETQAQPRWFCEKAEKKGQIRVEKKHQNPEPKSVCECEAKKPLKTGQDPEASMNTRAHANRATAHCHTEGQAKWRTSLHDKAPAAGRPCLPNSDSQVSSSSPMVSSSSPTRFQLPEQTVTSEVIAFLRNRIEALESPQREVFSMKEGSLLHESGTS